MNSYRKITKSKVLSIDTETTGLNAWGGDAPFAISFLNPDGDSLYFEWEVDGYTRTVIPEPLELELCAEVLGNKKTRKIFHGAKFDVRMMAESHGVETVLPIDDTMFMAHACNSLGSLALKPLGIKYLQYPSDDLVNLKKSTIRARREAKRLGWWRAEDVEADYWMNKKLDSECDLCEIYCGNDTERTILLSEFFARFMKMLNVTKIYEREMELWPITYKMESRGIKTDLDVVDREINIHEKAASKWQKIVMDAAWQDFDIESPQQCGKLIYNKLGLPIKKRTPPSKKFPEGQPQVNFDALSEHVQHPTVNALFKFRASAKALSNFFLKYKEFYIRDTVSPGEFVLHPDFNQVGPATGRYSCRRPNFQNVANALTTRSSEPIQAREPFGPRALYVWFHFDWSGQEVRIFAHVSQEELLLDALKKGLDVHTFTANKAWGGEDNPRAIDAAVHALELDGSGDGRNQMVLKLWKGYEIKKLSKLDDDDKILIAADWMEKFKWNIERAEASIAKKTCRARSKMLFFCKIFGGGAGAVGDLLGCDLEEAMQFLDDYDTLYPRINVYIRELSRQARKDGCIINCFDRRLSVSRDKPYVAVNYKVQGSAADMIKISMIKIEKYLERLGLNIHMIMEVHDELIFEFWKAHAFGSVLVDIKNIMEDFRDVFSIEMPVELERCPVRWNEKYKIKI